MEIQVRALDGVEEKSLQEKEQALLAKHEAEQAAAAQAAADAEAANAAAQAASEASQGAQSELDDETVLSYLGKRYNKEIKSFDDLVAERNDNEPLPEDVSAFLKYKKETGRGIEDFLKLQKDYDSVDPDQLLKEYYLSTNPDMDSDDLDVVMAEYGYDEDLDDDMVIKKAKLAKKKAIAQAKDYFNQQKEQYRIPTESVANAIPAAEKEEFEAYKQYISQAKTMQEEADRKRDWFYKKTDEVFSDGFKGFEFKLGEKSLLYTPSDAKSLKELQSNPLNFINKYVDESGLMNDAVGYHKALSIAMNPDKFAQFFYEQGKAEAIEGLDKKIKNIDMSANAATAVVRSGDTPSVRVLNPDSGNRLTVKFKK